MTVKELYEYAKRMGYEDKNIMIRINVNGFMLDFDEITTENINPNYYNDIVIDPVD